MKQTKYRNFVQKEASRRGWGSGFHSPCKKKRWKDERRKAKLYIKRRAE